MPTRDVGVDEESADAWVAPDRYNVTAAHFSRSLGSEDWENGNRDTVVLAESLC